MAFLNRVDPLDAAARSYASQISREAVLHGITVNFKADTVDWDEIFGAEATIIKNLKEPDLRRRAWIVYDRYTEVAGAEKAARRAAANTLNVDTSDLEVLRADLLQIHNEIARIYTIGFQVERQRAELTHFVLIIAVAALTAFMSFLGWASLKGHLKPEAEPWVLGAIVVVLLVAARLLYVWSGNRFKAGAAILAVGVLLTVTPHLSAQAPASGTQPPAPTATATATDTQQPAKPKDPAKPQPAKPPEPKMEAEKEPPRVPIVPIVMIAGILGATFSVLQRVQRNSSADPLLALLSFRAARPQVFLSIASGAIGALVLYAIFSGGMIQGDLFPKIVNGLNPEGGKTMQPLYNFLRETGPPTHADYGKLMVWAFIAGFAERFVPDILDRFTKS